MGVFINLFTIIFVSCLVVLLPSYGYSECSDCHGTKGSIEKTFANGEKIDAFVDMSKYKSSVHGRLSCTSCHKGYTDGHEGKKFKSLAEFKKKQQVCLDCHGEKLSKLSSHSNFIEEYKKGNPRCIECHDPHYSSKGIKGSGESYCMTCHSQNLTKTFKNGERISVKVDTRVLKNSVHKDLNCSDCHTGFSRTQHPSRVFSSYKEFVIYTTEGCRKCHFDKFVKSSESIHAKLLSEGVESAPSCVDCHGSHDVTLISQNKVVQVKVCGNCHGDVAEVYSKSVHGKAVIERKDNNAASCADCHTAHTVRDPKTFDYRLAIPGICGNCHGNAELMKKYNLSANVVNTYLSDFHGVTLKMYKELQTGTQKVKPIAVCTDCHGYHDVFHIDQSNMAMVKERLVKACATCHPGASKNFPDAWLPHYSPTLQNAPLVFLVKAFYSVFIPFMIAGLILNVLLHIWRYITGK